jgi:hypothetical protein
VPTQQFGYQLSHSNIAMLPTPYCSEEKEGALLRCACKHGGDPRRMNNAHLLLMLQCFLPMLQVF